MSMPFLYSTQFILDKAYFLECYAETAIIKSGITAYKKAIILFLLGMFATVIAQEHKALALFIVVLSFVEALSVYFAQIWWVWRQLLSKSGNTSVELVIDEQGIATSSRVNKLAMNWLDITNIQITDVGVIFLHANARHYLSRKCLSQEAITFIDEKKNKLNNKNK